MDWHLNNCKLSVRVTIPKLAAMGWQLRCKMFQLGRSIRPILSGFKDIFLFLELIEVSCSGNGSTDGFKASIETESNRRGPKKRLTIGLTFDRDCGIFKWGVSCWLPESPSCESESYKHLSRVGFTIHERLPHPAITLTAIWCLNLKASSRTLLSCELGVKLKDF